LATDIFGLKVIMWVRLDSMRQLSRNISKNKRNRC